MAVEVVIKVEVQLLFWVGGGGWVVVGEWSDYTKSILISTKVEVVVEVGVELGNIALKPPKHKVPYICAATSVRVLY